MILTVDIEWPATLPLPRLDYNSALLPSVIVSDGSAPTLQRRNRFTPLYKRIQADWIFTATEYAAFSTFFTTTLTMGVAAFSIELRYPKNTELTTWLVRLGSGFSRTPSENNLHQVKAEMLLLHQVNF